MTPDQWSQITIEFIGLASAVGYGTHRRKKILDLQNVAEDERVTRIEVEGSLTRDEMKETRKAIARLEVRLEDAEKADERLRQEMHALSGRVDAANVKYTELLTAFKARQKPSETIVEPGKKPDLQDQTKTIVKGEKS